MEEARLCGGGTAPPRLAPRRPDGRTDGRTAAGVSRSMGETCTAVGVLLPAVRHRHNLTSGTLMLDFVHLWL